MNLCLAIIESEGGPGFEGPPLFTALDQAVDLALDLVAHGLHLLHSQHLALNPLSHVLLLLLDDVVGDGCTAIEGWGVPGQVGVVRAPVQDVGLSARIRFIPRILHQDVISAHLLRIGLSNLVNCTNPEPVSVSSGQVLNLDLAR